MPDFNVIANVSETLVSVLTDALSVVGRNRRHDGA